MESGIGLSEIVILCFCGAMGIFIAAVIVVGIVLLIRRSHSLGLRIK